MKDPFPEEAAVCGLTGTKGDANVMSRCAAFEHLVIQNGRSLRR